MADLQQLMALPGAQAAFIMNDRGELIDHTIAENSKLNQTALDLLAHMCVANIAIATMQARGWEANSQNQGFYPVNGFTLVGMDWSAVTNGNLGVVIANNGADYEQAYAALAEQGGVA
jgi:roadblock/LC7 domain-containing protein